MQGEIKIMEMGTEKAREYILALKDSGNFTFEDIANLSGIPLPTVKNICSGKTPDARFSTIAKIILSMGGDLNELVGYEKKKGNRSQQHRFTQRNLRNANIRLNQFI